MRARSPPFHLLSCQLSSPDGRVDFVDGVLERDRPPVAWNYLVPVLVEQDGIALFPGAGNSLLVTADLKDPCQDYAFGIDGFPHLVRKSVESRCRAGWEVLQLGFNLSERDGRRLPLGIRVWFAQAVAPPVGWIVDVHVCAGGLIPEEGLEVGSWDVAAVPIFALQDLPHAPLSVAAE